MNPEQLTYYETLHKLVTKMRTAHWEAKKYRSASAAKRENDLGLQIDKIVRAENIRRTQEANKIQGTLDYPQYVEQ